MERTLFILGALFMFLGVGAGAFGSHALSSYFERFPNYESTWRTAVLYQMVHAVALFAIAYATVRFPGALANWAGILVVAGIVIFSGSLYLLVFTRIRWLGAITPIGGVAFLAGWICLLLAAFRSS